MTDGAGATLAGRARRSKTSSPSASLQLELDFDGPHPRPTNRIAVTRTMRKHRSCNQILEKVIYVRRFFPELDGLEIKVGLTRAASGMAIAGGNEMWLNPFRTSYHTIAHEFVHLLQRRGTGIPQGEKSCDVFALARHWTLNDLGPNYVKLPPSLVEVDGTLSSSAARLVYETAIDAVNKRQAGLRRYIAYFESQLLAATL